MARSLPGTVTKGLLRTAYFAGLTLRSAKTRSASQLTVTSSTAALSGMVKLTSHQLSGAA